MFRRFAMTLGTSVALCSAAYVAGGPTTANTASATSASSSHLTVQVAHHTMHRSGYVVASS